MISLSTTLLHGLLICIPFSIFALASFWFRPRLWLHSLPKDILQLAGPKTQREKNLTKFLLLPLFLLILPGLSIASAFYASIEGHISLSFPGALLHLYGIWSIVHVWDFVIIDCGAVLIIDPKHPPISGTEGARGWKDYRFHFRSMLKALVMSSLFVVPAAAIVSFVF